MAAAEPEQGEVERVLAEAEPGGELRVGQLGATATQRGLERLKNRPPLRRLRVRRLLAVAVPDGLVVE